MKSLFMLLLGLFFLAGCKKEAEPEPIPSVRVSGTYDVSRIAYDGAGTANDYDVTLPRSVSGIAQSATLVADRFNNQDNAVTVVVTIKSAGQPDQTIDLQDFDLKASGSGFDLMYNNLKYGTADGTTVKMDFTESGQRLIVEARRR